MKNTANADYSVVPAGGFIDKLLSSQRRKMFDGFTVFRQGGNDDTILNVSVLSTPLFDGTNYLPQWSSPHDKLNITSYELSPSNNHPPANAKERQRQVDGLRLPFRDGEFDWVFCSEGIERIGSFERQYALLQELTRVSRRGVFATTSNRKHPIEFNIGIPLIHWLPGAWWRRLLKLTGKNAWASKSVLNLLDANALYKLASLLPGKPKHDVGHKRLFGIKAHFFLMIEKNVVADNAMKKNLEETPHS